MLLMHIKNFCHTLVLYFFSIKDSMKRPKKRYWKRKQIQDILIKKSLRSGFWSMKKGLYNLSRIQEVSAIVAPTITAIKSISWVDVFFALYATKIKAARIYTFAIVEMILSANKRWLLLKKEIIPCKKSIIICEIKRKIIYATPTDNYIQIWEKVKLCLVLWLISFVSRLNNFFIVIVSFCSYNLCRV